MSCCPICFDDIKNNTESNKNEFDRALKQSITLDCEHTFHYGCIIEWFNTKIKKKTLESSIRKCPYCRICVPLSPKSKKKMERKERIKETKKILYFALANSNFGLSV